MNSSPNEPIISVHNVSFRFEEEEAPTIRTISFDVYAGESMMILGPSGSGKSTLTYCLNGQYPEAVEGVLDGNIIIAGKSVSDYVQGELSKTVGVVFQDPESQFCMTKVADEIAFGLENIGTPSIEIEEKIERTLSLVGMLPYKHSFIDQLSGGMKQKLAIACIISMEPRVLILDEPTAYLDPLSTREIAQLVGRLRKELDLTLLVIEHKLDEWMPYIDSMLVLDSDGAVTYQGEPGECFNQHRDELQLLGIWLPTVNSLGEQWVKDGLYEGLIYPITREDLIAGTKDCDVAITRLNAESPHLQRKHTEKIYNPILQVNNLSYSKGDKSILQGVDLTIYSGECIAIVGPNGAGKTTLVHHLSGLIEVMSGEIKLKGKPIEHWKEAELRKEIGFVFQNPEHQFITDTVYDEAAFSLRMQGLRENSILTKVTDLLKQLQLEHLHHHNPFTLSQGQKRRLSVATMLVDEQQILILDEPTYGQDASTSHHLLQLLNDGVMEGKTTILVTHDMNIVNAYADRAVLILNGKVSYSGDPMQLWSMTSLLQEAKLLPPSYVELAQAFKVIKDNHEVKMG